MISRVKDCINLLCWLVEVVSNSCDPMDCSTPGSSVHGISQARILESVAIFFSRGSSWTRNGIQVPSCCNEIPQARRLKQQNCVVFLETRNLRSKCPQCWFLLRPLSLACRWPSSSASSRGLSLLPASQGCLPLCIRYQSCWTRAQP